MRKHLFLISFTLLAIVTLQTATAQTGLQGMNYQAVARNASGAVVASQPIRVRFTILASTTSQYSEVHTTTTTAQGLFTLIIGKGTVQSGTFAGITWNTANHSLRTEIDVTGGTSYVTIGTTTFQSVPYALYSINPGPQGAQGLQGIQGPPGQQGAQGLQGNSGAQGLQGIQGLKGDKGDKGDQGNPGNPGAQGAQGIQGPQGLKGDKGDQGDPGPQGLQGNPGAQGLQGIQGIQGLQGVPGTASNDVWKIDGNAGINGNLHFIGTIDVNPLVFRTNNTNRMQIRNNGQLIINSNTVVSTTDGLEVFGTGRAGALSNFNFPINGYLGNTNGSAIYGENQGSGQGVLGSNNATGAGVYGMNSGAAPGGFGVMGVSTNNFGVMGQTGNVNAAGIRGINTNVNGVGIIGLGSGLTTTISPGASGTGVVGYATSFGIVGYTPNTGSPDNRWGGYFDNQASGNGYAFVGGRAGGTDYGILSTGAKSTIVNDEQGRGRIMYCTEAPEVLFQDFGTGQLQNGTTHITLDPLLTRNIRVDESHPLKVFIQLEGDCNGVFVTNKSSDGFDVKELQQGRSNVSFTWQIVATRADAKDANGRVSEFSSQRFPIAPERIKGKELQTVTEAQSALPARVINSK